MCALSGSERYSCIRNHTHTHTHTHTHKKTSSIVKEKVELNSLVHNTHTHTHTLQRHRHKKAFHYSRDTRKRLHFERLRYEKERHSSHRKHVVRLDGTHTHAHTEESSTHNFISHLKVTNATLYNFSKYFRKAIVVPCRGPDPVRVK